MALDIGSAHLPVDPCPASVELGVTSQTLEQSYRAHLERDVDFLAVSVDLAATLGMPIDQVRSHLAAALIEKRVQR